MPAWRDLFFATHPDVYEPSDDTWLLAEVVGEVVQPGQRFLEVGCGAGISAMVASRAGADVTATDANVHAVTLARHNARENRLDMAVVETDLLAGLRGPFDVVAFNPPYLPTAPEDVVQGPLNLAFDGGPDGNAVVLRFVDQVAELSPRPQTLLVIHSSLSDPAPLVAALADLGYVDGVAASRRFFYEELTVRRFDQGATR